MKRASNKSIKVSKLFSQIRDISYSTPLSFEEKDCCCVGKNRLLLEKLTELGLTVRWRVCEFLWSSLSLPKKVADTQHDDLATHAYLEALIGESWQTVDATWDRGLALVLPIATWDGKNSTALAVKPTKIYSPEKSAEIMGNLTREEFEKDMKINGEFYRAFNKWLAEARNPNPSQSYKIVRIVDPEELSKLRDKVAAYKNFTFSFSSEYIGKLKSHLADKHACQLFAIDEEGTVAGYIASSEALFPDYQWIIELFIDPEFQKKGIATKLMDDTAAWAQSHKLKGLVTETEFKNIPAQKFYEKYGFEKIENPGWKDGFTYQLKFKDSL